MRLFWDRVSGCMSALEIDGLYPSSVLSGIVIVTATDALWDFPNLLAVASPPWSHLDAREELIRGKWRSLLSQFLLVKNEGDIL